MHRTSSLLIALLSITHLTECAKPEAGDEATPTKVAAPLVVAKPPASKEEAAPPAVRVPIEGLPAFGSAQALVTVVAFTDYECPYCAKAELRWQTLQAEYGARLRVVVASHPLPIHDNAPSAARAFLAAVEQGKGEAMHARLFAMNAASNPLDDEGLRNAARECGLDVERFDRARRGRSTEDALHVAEAVAAKLGVDGTPTFFVNGRRVVGARPIETFRALVDEELGKAKLLEAKGVGPDGVYGRLLATLPEAPSPKAEPSATNQPVVDVDVEGAPVRGPSPNAIAPVTIVFFSDFECPYCVKAETTLRSVEAARPGKVRIAFRQRPLPMHEHARLAAVASIAASMQGKFWEYHDVLLTHRDALQREDLLRYAAEVGLDRPRFVRDLDDPAVDARVQADLKRAETLDVKGTPTAFVNGRRITGAQPLSAWLGLVDRALANP